MTRRSFLTTTAVSGSLASAGSAARRTHAPAMFAATGRRSYSHAELEAKIARRDFRGLTKADLPTPNLILNEDVFGRNLKTMSGHCERTGFNLRAHVKVHRSPEIAKRQIEAGSIGLCCASISECEVMIDGGMHGILWTRQPAGPNTISRVVALAKRDSTFMTAIDDPVIVGQLDEAARAAGVTVKVVVDNDVGIGRQGVKPGQEAVDLSKRVMKAKNLKLGGLMGYSGKASHTHGWQKRKQVSEEAVGRLLESVSLCRAAGIPVEIVTGGSTGTYNIDSEIKGMTELQAGSYALMDSKYKHVGSKDGGEAYDDFGVSLTVLTTVISKHYPNKAAIDAGNKSATQPTDEVKGRPDLTVARAGAEYGALRWEDADPEPKLGDQFELITSNLDMTTNYYDRIFVCRRDQVVDVYSILGRKGPSQR
jgi:D-serine deaminase-like pyridoxal phosphate-dependent protein